MQGHGVPPAVDVHTARTRPEAATGLLEEPAVHPDDRVLSLEVTGQRIFAGDARLIRVYG
ncbi:hypothetical protein GCM10010206_03090 [Streptomyces cinerochromogenes]|nr:hypothetical protein GCM10010206_03090 [Streptomyces cinerochromogenes]